MPRELLATLVGMGLVTLLGCDGCDENDQKKAAQPQPEPQEAELAREAESEPETEPEPTLPDSLPKGLLVVYAQFEGKDAQGRPKPGAARLEALYRRGGAWETAVIEDPESNVFHLATVYDPPHGEPGILTLGGTEAILKLWRRDDEGFQAETLWQEDFGGKHNRMRDAEVADVDGDGEPEIAVGTHDQGVVALVDPKQDEYTVEKLDREENTFIHEIEIGDLNDDDVLEIYATPSEPNRLEGQEQSGTVVRYVPAKDQGREVVADLGNRHAKEIYVGDVDGDGTDELYAAVEALTKKQDDGSVKIVEDVEIRRYEHDTPADQGVVVAKLPDRFCRFLTVGDVDGDERKEMVAAGYRSGVWLISPPPEEDPNKPWRLENIDRESGGFEHASVLADLDEDGREELYVADDNEGELRRYVWDDEGHVHRETIHSRDDTRSMLTWNLMPAPVERFAPPAEAETQ